MTTSGNVWSGARPDTTGYHSSRTEDHISLKKVWMISMSSVRVSSELQLSLKYSCALSTPLESELVAAESRESAFSMRLTTISRLVKWSISEKWISAGARTKSVSPWTPRTS